MFGHILGGFTFILVYGSSRLLLSYAFSNGGNKAWHSDNKICISSNPFRVFQTHEATEVPPFHLDEEKIKNQVLHLGPLIPQEEWQKPEAPPAFSAYRGMASDFRFCKPDRPVMSRMMRRKYKQVIYKHVRAKYKKYIKYARNVGELMYWKAKLDSLPKDSSKTRYNRICMITGRTRAVYRIVGLTRHKFREYAYKGLIPGIKRANW